MTLTDLKIKVAGEEIPLLFDIKACFEAEVSLGVKIILPGEGLNIQKYIDEGTPGDYMRCMHLIYMATLHQRKFKSWDDFWSKITSEEVSAALASFTGLVEKQLQAAPDGEEGGSDSAPNPTEPEAISG